MGVTAAVAAAAVAAYTVDSTEKQKALANNARNDQKTAQAEAEAKMAAEQVQNDTELTQKKNRSKAMARSKQDAATGREGTILGSANPNPAASYQTKTLLGQ